MLPGSFGRIIRQIFQWGVSLALLCLALLYLVSVARFFLRPNADNAAQGSMYDAGVHFSIAVALFGLAGVNFWVFIPDDETADAAEVLPETPPGETAQ